MNLIKFIEESPLDKIETGLADVLKSLSSYCDEVLGRGYFGEVRSRTFGETIGVQLGDVTVEMPVAIKRIPLKVPFQRKRVGDVLYIRSSRDITVEAIILYYVSKLWYNEVTPHVPFMVAMGVCDDDTVSVNQIITERQGLREKIDVGPPLLPLERRLLFKLPSARSYLATIRDLLLYVIGHRQGDSVTLPNGKECSAVEICDNLVISYLHTADLVFRTYKLSLIDMNPDNLLIHWVGEASYMGKRSLAQLRKIVYRVGSGYLGIETHGFLFKLGDLGACIMRPRPDVYFVGTPFVNEEGEVEPTPEMVGYFGRDNVSYVTLLTYFQSSLPYDLFIQTVLHKIFLTYPFNRIVLWFGSPDVEFPTPGELLASDAFKKYRLDRPPSEGSGVLII